MSIPILPTRSPDIVKLFKNDFVIAALIAIVLSSATFAVGFALGWFPEGVNGFEVAGATINYGATYLSIKQRRFTYALGFVASMAFAVAYFQYGLLASAILSAYLVLQLIYGFFRWGPDGASRPVHKLQAKWIPAYVLATAVTYAGAWAISTAFGGQFAPLDAAILVLTIAAQFLLDNKVIFAWYIWMLVNIVGVVLYTASGAPFAAVQQFIFGLANIWGYLAWRKTMLNSGENFSEEANSKNQPKEESELTFTESDTDEWRKPDPTDLALSGRGLGKGRSAKEALIAQKAYEAMGGPVTEEYTGSSKVAATYHDPTPTTETDQIKP